MLLYEGSKYRLTSRCGVSYQGHVRLKRGELGRHIMGTEGGGQHLFCYMSGDYNKVSTYSRVWGQLSGPRTT